MNHEEQARRRQIALYRAMTPTEKYRCILELRAFSREVKAAGVRSAHPDWTEGQVQQEVRKIFLYART